MIDKAVLAERPELVKEHLARRHASPEAFDAVDRAVALAARRRALVTELNGLQARRNAASKEIGALMKAGRAPEATALRAEVGAGNARIEAIDADCVAVESALAEIALGLPNLLHDSVPEGSDESHNPEILRWGAPRRTSGDSHVEIGTRLGILDLDRAAKLSGARFSVLRGEGARLERALIQWFLDVHVGSHGYTEVLVPYLVQRPCAVGTGQLPKFEGDMFRLADKLNGEDGFLVPTAEVPVTNLHRDEILDGATLPLRYAAFTPCFRSEAGSAGRDVRGIIRQHQFHKVELVHITTADRAEADHLALRGHAEALLQALDLHYRVVLHCGGETSFGAHRCFDLEVWLPSQGAFREISSCSHFSDFQARRMDLRYRDAAGKVRFAHTLNGSALAVGRTWVAILENYVQDDGSVVVPDVLRPYMGGLERIRAA
jgi:seryl-tRNA synthetase